jgi:hypothetical protein
MIVHVNHSNIGRRLGNQILPLANMLALGADLGQSVMFPSFIPYASSFVGTAGGWSPCYSLTAEHGSSSRLIDSRQNVWRAFWFAARIGRALGVFRFEDWGVDRFLHLSTPETKEIMRKLGSRLILRGFYCIHDDALTLYGDQMRAFFALVPEMDRTVAECLASPRGEAEIVVGVHLRIGDYRDFLGGILHYRVDEFRELMNRIRGLFPKRRVAFLVCTNEPALLEEVAIDGVHRGPGGSVTDLYALASCDYIFGPPSTYSAWASFYGRVPRFVLPVRSVEERELGTLAAPQVTSFKVHQWGYGAYETFDPEARLVLRP